jgi:hypothetical protein
MLNSRFLSSKKNIVKQDPTFEVYDAAAEYFDGIESL